MRVLLAFLLILTYSAGCSDVSRDPDLSMYQYRDTKNLVRFVYGAAGRLQAEGISALDHFREHRKRFDTGDYYLYIYDMQGNNLFHAGMPELEGHNLADVTDIQGKNVTRMILEALDNPHNPHAWIHYSWWEPGKFYPVPKSSCHFKVEMPDGRLLFAGGGLNHPHEEKAFIRIIVDDAAARLTKDGRQAVEVIADPLSRYRFRNVRVFLFHPDGTTLLAPNIDSEAYQLNLLDFTDEAGHTPFVQAIAKMESAESTWEVFVAKQPCARGLAKKILYIRRALMDGEIIYVAAVTDMPAPPY